MSTPRPYSRASLIDRLIDTAPKSAAEYPPRRGQTRQEALVSLARDLNWLLNTRCPLGITELERREARTVLDYGIPDFGTFFVNNPEDHLRLAELIESTISAFEPRLQNVRVNLQNDPENPHRGLIGWLEGTLRLNEIEEPLSFPLVLDSRRQWAVESGQA